jgi:hypothetical protein
MRKTLILAVLALYASLNLAAQDAAFIERISSSNALSCAEAAYLVMVGAEKTNEAESPDQALIDARTLGAATTSMTGESPIRMDRFAFMIMKAFELKGGIFYSLFPSPRYAYRELISKGVIQGNADPADPVDGSMALRMTGRVADTGE